MNKLMGFYELKDANLPTINWKEYTQDTVLDDKFLWTVRTAVYKGDDLNLPRIVGVTSSVAKEFADSTLKSLSGEGMVIYYPYFIADKSGTLDVYNDKVVIEAVKDDLWNLVTFSKRDVTIIFRDGQYTYDGDSTFIKNLEMNEIMACIPNIKMKFRDILTTGRSTLFEWSYAYNCDINKNRIGDKYLVFYEARAV